MKKTKNRILLVVTAILLMVCCLVPTVAAQSTDLIPYTSYEYNSFEESTPAPDGYIPEKVVKASDWGLTDLSSAQDMCFSADGKLYILDSGNGRILVTDSNLNLQRQITSFTDGTNEYTFAGAQGLFVCTNGDILVADTQAHRILKADNTGKIIKILTRPDTALLSASKEFLVNKVMEDNNGIIYVLVKGVNEGAITYNIDGSFGGFFASNEVKQTLEVLTNYVWRNFMTEEQIRNSQSYMPAEFTNFDLNEKGFIYTVTQTADEESSIRKLNFKGSNIQVDAKLGDLEWDRKIKDSISTVFVDVDVDENGYISLLDQARGRVFRYSQDGILVSVFGALGTQTGTFKSPVAVETYKGKVYVLDSLLNNITVFSPTEYATTMINAINLYQNGDYTNSLEYWNKVLKLNSNSESAYLGIGMALDEAGNYKEACKYFKLAYDNEAYSDSFKEVREDFVKSNFLLLSVGLVLLIAGIIIGIKLLSKKFGRKNEYIQSPLEHKYAYPLFIIKHPFDGFADIKQKKAWSMTICFGILIALFLGLCAKFFCTGFSFNQNRASDFNVFITLAQAFGIIFVWSISNWAVCTLIEGKGRFKDIFCMSCYALIPFVISLILSVFVSNILSLDEQSILIFVEQLGLWWSIVLMLSGLSSIHQFSFSKTLLSVVLTIVGIAVIIFLAIMFFGLMKQTVSFVKSIYSELKLML